MKKYAIVYCEHQFGSMDGKTANGLVRDSGLYEIVAVIDSTKAGQDAGEVLDQKKNGIPICKNLQDAIASAKEKPNYFILGIAPANAFLKKEERQVIIEAMEAGMHIINPLQEFLTEDEEMMTMAKRYGVTIRDVRKPRPKKNGRCLRDVFCK